MQRSWAKFRIKVMIELGAPVDQKGKIIGLEYDSRNRVRIPKDRDLNGWERLYKKLEFYSLRHTYRTEPEEAGVLPTVAAAITGHDAEKGIIPHLQFYSILQFKFVLDTGYTSKRTGHL